MNERIKELYAESVMSVHDAFIDRMLIPSAVDLQFAQLIVEECIASIPSDGHRGDFLRGVEFCQLKIKAQFGIAE